MLERGGLELPGLRRSVLTKKPVFGIKPNLSKERWGLVFTSANQLRHSERSLRRPGIQAMVEAHGFKSWPKLKPTPNVASGVAVSILTSD